MKAGRRWTAGLWVLIAMCTSARAQQPAGQGALPVFDVASVRPNKSDTSAFRLMFTPDGVRVQNASALMIVRAAYGMFNSLDDKFIGVPAWAKAERFDIEAKVAAADAPRFAELSFADRQRMVQALLIERFQLKAHEEMREQPVYDLMVAKGGPKLLLTKHVVDAEIKMEQGPGRIAGEEAVVGQLVTALTQALGRTVIDQTGLTRKYDFTLRWTPEMAGNEPGQADGPSLFTAVEEQLGLKLSAGRGMVKCLVIDHLARPSEN